MPCLTFGAVQPELTALEILVCLAAAPANWSTHALPSITDTHPVRWDGICITTTSLALRLCSERVRPVLRRWRDGGAAAEARRRAP
eukprot:1513301-Pyramimonas_sp.AAC.1